MFRCRCGSTGVDVTNHDHVGRDVVDHFGYTTGCSTRRMDSVASATSMRRWSDRHLGRPPLDGLDVVVIESVGNLVCPAEFDVGADARAHQQVP